MPNDRRLGRQGWRAGSILTALVVITAVAAGGATRPDVQSAPTFTPARPLGDVVTALPGTTPPE